MKNIFHPEFQSNLEKLFSGENFFLVYDFIKYKNFEIVCGINNFENVFSLKACHKKEIFFDDNNYVSYAIRFEIDNLDFDKFEKDYLKYKKLYVYK